MTVDIVSTIEERMWTEKEAAYLLHVSPVTLTYWRKLKKVTFFRLPNGTIRYRKNDLNNLLKDSLRVAEQNCDTQREFEGIE